MKKTIICLAAIASLFSCTSNNHSPELGTETVYEYYDAAQTKLKSIANYKAGDEKQRKHAVAGLQLLEMYNREEILSPLIASGLDSVIYSWKGTFLDQNSSMNALPFIFSVNETDMRKLQQHLLTYPDILKLFPEDMEFMWSAKADEDFREGEKPAYHLYAIRHSPLTVNYADIAECSVGENQGMITITVSMTESGPEKWSVITDNNKGRHIAITVNNRVYSAPKVYSRITGGKTEISGNFTKQEATEMMQIINAFVLNGEWRSYHENGKLKEIRQYEKGERVGEWSTFDENGKLIKKRGGK